MIINKTKKNIISKQERICTTPLSQMIGLMFKKKQNIIMVLKQEKKIALHNLFVFYSHDLLILNKEQKIIEIKQQFKPFTLWRSATKGKYLLELPVPLTKTYELGDQLAFSHT